MVAVFAPFFLTLCVFGIKKHIFARPTFWFCAFLALAFASYFYEAAAVYVRYDGDIMAFSSGRLEGVLLMLPTIFDNPFQGVGFGAADSGYIHPGNLFYPGILWETGIFGLVGALIIVLYLPIVRLYEIFRGRLGVQSKLKYFVSDANNYPLFISIFSVSWLLFEFDVLRVSAHNQTLFFCLGWLLALVSKGKKANSVAQ